MHARFVRRFLAVAVLIVASGLTASQVSAAEVFTDPAKAGDDFQVQGEYVGEATGASGTEKVGAKLSRSARGNSMPRFMKAACRATAGNAATRRTPHTAKRPME